MPTIRNTWHFQLNIVSVEARSLLNYQQVTVLIHSVVLKAEPQTNMLQASITDSFSHGWWKDINRSSAYPQCIANSEELRWGRPFALGTANISMCIRVRRDGNGHPFLSHTFGLLQAAFGTHHAWMRSRKRSFSWTKTIQLTASACDVSPKLRGEPRESFDSSASYYAVVQNETDDGYATQSAGLIFG